MGFSGRYKHGEVIGQAHGGHNAYSDSAGPEEAQSEDARMANTNDEPDATVHTQLRHRLQECLAEPRGNI